MLTPDDPTLAPEFHSLERRLAQWRRKRPHIRARIPEPLWAEAVVLARRHGVGATARALHLGYEGLTARLARAGSAAVAARADRSVSVPRGKTPPATPATFVELPIVAPPAAAATWVFEFQGRGGDDVVRVQTPPWSVAELVALARRVWSGA